MNIKIFGLIILAVAFILSAWFFFWPLVECTYALSWEPLVSNSLKLMLFLFGGTVFVISFVLGVRILI